MRAWKKEKLIAEKKKQEEDEAAAKITLDFSPKKENHKEGGYEGMSFDFLENVEKVEIEFER